MDVYENKAFDKIVKVTVQTSCGVVTEWTGIVDGTVSIEMPLTDFLHPEGSGMRAEIFFRCLHMRHIKEDP